MIKCSYSSVEFRGGGGGGNTEKSSFPLLGWFVMLLLSVILVERRPRATGSGFFVGLFNVLVRMSNMTSLPLLLEWGVSTVRCLAHPSEWIYFFNFLCLALKHLKSNKKGLQETRSLENTAPKKSAIRSACNLKCKFPPYPVLLKNVCIQHCVVVTLWQWKILGAFKNV